MTSILRSRMLKIISRLWAHLLFTEEKFWNHVDCVTELNFHIMGRLFSASDSWLLDSVPFPFPIVTPNFPEKKLYATNSGLRWTKTVLTTFCLNFKLKGQHYKITKIKNLITLSLSKWQNYLCTTIWVPNETTSLHRYVLVRVAWHNYELRNKNPSSGRLTNPRVGLHKKRETDEQFPEMLSHFRNESQTFPADSWSYGLQWRGHTIQPTVAHVKIMSNDLRWMTNEINQFTRNEETKIQFIVLHDTFYTNKSGWKIVTKKKSRLLIPPSFRQNF